MIKQHRASRLQLIFIYKRQDADVVLAAHWRGHDGVVVINDLLQVTHWHGRASQLINFCPFLLHREKYYQTFKVLQNTTKRVIDCLSAQDMGAFCVVKLSLIHFLEKAISTHHTPLTHWGRVTHICVGDLTIIGSDNGLSPERRQAIIRTNAGILLIRPLGTNFGEFLVEILMFSFKKMRLKVSSAKRRPFCLGLNELTEWETKLMEHSPKTNVLYVSYTEFHLSRSIFYSASKCTHIGVY